MNIITLSGGISSAWVADWVLENVDKNAILYFNDTKWEHEDLYRFLSDLEKYWGKKIYNDSDGRSPEDVFYDQNMLANNRVPLCSRILKADRLQKFAKPGDVCFFGIDGTEAHRAVRIKQIYDGIGIKTRFPMLETETSKEQVLKWLESSGIKIPKMYELGFTHNNCSGGCVRAGKRQWLHLLKTLPEVFAERERVENDFMGYSGKKATYMKDMSLSELRKISDMQIELDFTDDETATECIGICNLEN